MENYNILKQSLYDSIILSLLKRNILSLDEAVGCLNETKTETKTTNDLYKDLSMVEQKGLTNSFVGKPHVEVVKYE